MSLSATLRSLARLAGRWLVALVALLVATSFGALEVAGAHVLEQAGIPYVAEGASEDAPGAAGQERDVPEERDEDEERDDEPRSEALTTSRAGGHPHARDHRLDGVSAGARRLAWLTRGERSGHGRTIDRPPHA